MNFGSDTRPLGRYIVDIDGSLRATDTDRVSPADLIALHGAAGRGSTLMWDRSGETIPLRAGDRIELDEGTVYYFRTIPGHRTAQPALAGIAIGRRRVATGEAMLHAAA